MERVIKNLAPSWPATVMGTGVVPLVFNLAAPAVPWMREAALAFFILSTVLLLVILVAMGLRLLLHRAEFAKDFRHPVAGSFLPTLPIALVILALGFLNLGTELFGREASLVAAEWLFGLGSAGIWLLGIAVISGLFASAEVKHGHATFGWFIPPVSQLIVAAGGLELAKARAGTPAADLYFLLAVVGLGIGLMLFLLVGANVYHRYLFHELPGAKLAPTMMIGMAPSSIVVVILAKLVAVSGSTSFAIGGLAGLAAVLGVAGWGFSAFWFLLSLLVLGRGFREMRMNFGLSWWAMTFPLGAFALATGALGKLLGSSLLEPVLVGLSYLLLVVWATIALGTIRAMGSGRIFERNE